MEINRVIAVYFSPTQSSQRYVREVAKRLSLDFHEINLTDSKLRLQTFKFGSNDLVIFGSPVYYGRLPEIDGGLFSKVFGDNTLAICTVTYGNRDFEDALLEEKLICEKNGFKPIAAAAFVAEHTYSDKVATGRPNADDFATVDMFVENIKGLIKSEKLADKTLEVKGSFPHRTFKKTPFVPVGDKNCNGCGACVTVCPMCAIDVNEPRKTDKSKCIICFACVKRCSHNARGIRSLIFKFVLYRLVKRISLFNKVNEFFYMK